MKDLFGGLFILLVLASYDNVAKIIVMPIVSGKESFPQPKDLDGTAKDLLRCGSGPVDGRTEAQFGLKGSLSDLHIELGLKFPELFPEPNEPLPWEEDYAKALGITPIVFSGLPESGSIEIFEVDYRPRFDYSFYEITINLKYLDASGKPWTFKLGKNSPDPGIFRTIMIPARYSTEYEGQGTLFSERPGVDEDFAGLVSRYTGDLSLFELR